MDEVDYYDVCFLLIIFFLAGIAIGTMIMSGGYKLTDEAADNICKEIAGENYEAIITDTDKVKQDRLTCKKIDDSSIVIKNGVEIKDGE